MYLVAPTKTSYTKSDIRTYGINGNIFVDLPDAIEYIKKGQRNMGYAILDLDKLEWIEYKMTISTEVNKDYKLVVQMPDNGLGYEDFGQ